MDKIMSKTNDTSKLRIEDVEAFTLNLSGANTFLPCASYETTS
jgi:hypothetical protein